MLRNIIFWVTQKRWFLFAVLTGSILYFLETPEGLSLEGYRTLIIVIMAIILIISEPIPLPGVAIMMLFLQVLLGIDEPNNVAKSFMNDAVFFIMGSLMLAVAIVSQGLDSRLALGIIKLTGNKTWRIVFGFVSISAFLSSFIGEHTVTAMMMPVGLTLIYNTSTDRAVTKNLAALILFSIAYGSAMGSIGTPSGGGRNVIMIEYWQEFGLADITYLGWMKYAYPMLLFEIPIAVTILWFTFKPKQKVLDSAVRKLKIQVAKKGPMTGQDLTTIIVFFLVFLGWVFLSNKIGLGIIALMGVFLYLVLGLIRWSDLNRNTNWGVILLFGAAISIGLQMKETGAALWIANSVIDLLKLISEDISVLRWVVAVLLTGTLTNLLSNSATIAVIGPIVLNMGGDPLIMGFSTAIASAFAYLTVVASPTCMIIHSSGLVKQSDYMKAGWKMFIMSIIVLFIMSKIWTF
ncbi:MAG: DASS family sodium-coupled anion symporter [Candidatus Marinimicrobia bacterium]|nr:DASS family sodium-coupled anion symporter [Candidatus Neomarinimicrobiota bacterium]HJM46539.1 DASS family sodium-coupled anion symporter [Candidatus Neomarinimicrobiota bacterium]